MPDEIYDTMLYIWSKVIDIKITTYARLDLIEIKNICNTSRFDYLIVHEFHIKYLHLIERLIRINIFDIIWIINQFPLSYYLYDIYKNVMQKLKK